MTTNAAPDLSWEVFVTPGFVRNGPVVFLAFDDASYITGTELFLDGGFAQV
jgi:NAD(P)-dependent dehydrogenase (short-subunit alcohol dehydrogenase family)